MMGGRKSGRRLMEYDYSVFGEKLFIRSDEFMRATGMKYPTLWNRVYNGMLYSYKYGKYMYVLNPCADFGKQFDSLPALLSCKDICNFLGIPKISSSLMSDIGFFRVAGERVMYTDKQSFAEHLMSAIRDR